MARSRDSRQRMITQISGKSTDEALSYLQGEDWDINRLVPKGSRGKMNKKFPRCNSKSKQNGNSSSDGIAGIASVKNRLDCTKDPELRKIRVMSWNVNGRHQMCLQERVQGICDTINKEKPHVVLLQEVVMETRKILEEKCPSYDFVPGGENEYYTAILLQRNVTTLEGAIIRPFYSSIMHRNLLTVKCTVKGIKFDILTSHLETTKKHAKARKNQLKLAFESVRRADADRTVIFGGDLNLRDNELSEIGGMPENVYDVWEVTGKRPEAKFTWDMTRNDNLEYGSKFKPKCRFDRLYVRHSRPKALVQPVYFELVGLERLQSCQRFPSDHWGLLGHFNVLSRLPAAAKK